MKRSLKAALLAGAATAALVGPAATPANAALCVGVWHDTYGQSYYGAWTCDSCPGTVGIGDGRIYAVLCPRIG